VHESVFHFTAEGTGWRVEAAAQWTRANDESVLSFANAVRTALGGSHETGFRAAVARVIRSFVSYIGREGTGKARLSAKDCCAGLTAVLSVWLAEPLWGCATKDRLFNPEVRPLVHRHTVKHLTKFLLRDGDETDLILARVLAARDTRVERASLRRSRSKPRAPGETHDPHS
jgi:DNA gyrase subunit B/topoisomerase-4 subunit B